jgi:multiple sugar transport system permease protein
VRRGDASEVFSSPAGRGRGASAETLPPRLPEAGEKSFPRPRLTAPLVLLALGGLLVALPFVWMVTTSFKTPEAVARPGINLWPDPWTVQGYVAAFHTAPWLVYLKNTVLITVFSVVGTVLASSMAAFAFARLRAPGSGPLFVLVLATLMLPAQVTMIPAFIIFRSLGWYDTLLPLIVPAFFGSAVYIFLIRQFFLTLPNDLEDAARIDGCGTWTIYWRILLPLATPALVTVALFAFVGAWNDFMGPLIYLNSLEKRTLALGLVSFQNAWGVDIVQVMAASTVITLPVLVVFFLFQRYFIEGVVTTGLKG